MGEKMSEEKIETPKVVRIDFSVEEIAEITGLIDMAVKARGLSYAPIALFLNNKFQSALNPSTGKPKETEKL